MRPSKTWLLLVPLAIIGGLQLVRDEVIRDPAIRELTIREFVERYFPAWSAGVYLSLFLLLILVITIVAATHKYVRDVRDLEDASRVKQDEAFYTIEREYHDLSDTHGIFWDMVRIAFSKFKQSTANEDMPALHDLIDRATFPHFYPLPVGSNLLERAEQWSAQACGADQLLWNFVAQLYEPKADGGFQTDLLDDEQLERLHQSRMKLTKYWHRCGELIEDGRVSFQRVYDTQFINAKRTLILLTYLNTRLAQCLSTGTRVSEPTQAMYRLVRKMLDVEEA